MIVDIYVCGRQSHISKQLKKTEYHKLLAVLKQNSRMGDPELFKFEDGSIIRLRDVQYLDVSPEIPSPFY
jgi:hypothetical protein